MSTIVPPPTPSQLGPPHYADATITLHHQPTDGFSVLAGLPDGSVDSVVTDPPYGLEFMGKEWDGADGFRRSLNPADAGRDNAFGRTSRTSPEYRTASRAQATRRQEGGIRQASGPSFLGGLNPRCQVCDRWQRGSNPCRCDAPAWTQERLVRLHAFQEWCEAWATECLRVLKPGGHMLAFGGTRTWHRLACAVEDVGFEIRDNIADFYDPDPSGLYGPLAWLYGSGFPKSLNLVDEEGERTGWGTALKPGFEPILMARKPLVGTVAANVAKYGTGAVNIDACRVGNRGEVEYSVTRWKPGAELNREGGTWKRQDENAPTVDGLLPPGRWPANVIFDESQAEVLDKQTGELTSGKMLAGTKPKGERTTYGQDAAAGYETCRDTPGDSGGASRFFYVAKADASERVKVNGVAHPTVKPLDIMRWLVRLVTPVGGTVLEPFAGSGTTVEACILEGFSCVAIERDETYLPLIRQRIDRRRDPVAAVRGAGVDGGLFDLLDNGGAA